MKQDEGEKLFVKLTLVVIVVSTLLSIIHELINYYGSMSI
jgi:hypothetical protein